MEIGRGGGGTPAALILLFFFFALAAVVVAAAPWSSPSAAAPRPCFDACFDQCVPRDEFWFCQLSCYHRCGGRARGCGERPCVLALCAELRPGTKMMVACQDTCRQSYAGAAACTDDVIS